MTEQDNQVKQQRIRRVTTDVVVPQNGETVGKISLNVAGVEELVNYEVDLATLPVSFLYHAALAGMVSRLGIAYSGVIEPGKIVEAIKKELGNFDNGKFVSRNTADHTVKAPDIVKAWVIAVGKDAGDAETVKVYAEAWKNRSEADKAKIKADGRVATAYSQLLFEKRLGKVGDGEGDLGL